MREEKLKSDFSLFNDILDNIKTKEEEEAAFFNVSHVSSRSEGEIRSSVFSVSDDGKDVKPEDPTKSFRSYTDEWEDNSTTTTKTITTATTTDQSHENQSVKRSSSQNLSSSSEDSDVESKSERNSLVSTRLSSLSTRTNSEITMLPLSRNSSSDSSKKDELNPEMDTENADKESSVLYKEIEKISFMSDFRSHHKGEQFLIQVKREESTKNYSTTAESAPPKRKKKKSKRKKKKSKKPSPDEECYCKGCESERNDIFLQTKLQGVFDHYESPAHIVKFPRPPRRKGENCQRKLDSRLKESENPTLLSWLSEKDKDERTKRREEKKAKKLELKEKRRQIIEKEKRNELSEAQVKIWMETKRKFCKSKEKQTPAPEKETKNPNRVEKPQMTVSLGKHYSTVRQFTDSIIEEAVEEMSANARLKTLRLRRPKTTATLVKKSSVEKKPCAPLLQRPTTAAVGFTPYRPKTTRARLTTSRPVWHATTPGFSKTFDEWLAAKRELDSSLPCERVNNQHFEHLERKIVQQEQEGRSAERNQALKSAQTRKNPYMISTKLYPIKIN